MPGPSAAKTSRYDKGEVNEINRKIEKMTTLLHPFFSFQNYFAIFIEEGIPTPNPPQPFP